MSAIFPIIAQIDASGGISANWVLVIMAGIIGALLYFWLYKIDKTLSDISKLVQLHDKQIALLEERKKDKDDDL